MIQPLTEESVRQAGLDHGKAAGSWVIDGNTTEDTARRILEGYDDGDPEILDMEPQPLSGEWADGLAPRDIVPDDMHDPSRDHLLDVFEMAFSEGFWDEVCRSARAIL